jgi:nitrite reductase/ring-hydroxylating ferredoxin subunit
MDTGREYVVGQIEELPLRKPVLVQIGDRVIGVYRVAEKEVRVYENLCPHLGGPVCQGEVVEWAEEVVAPTGEVVGQRVVPDRWHIVCPWHGLEFDLDTGRCVADPRLRLRPYPSRVEDGVVYVRA